MLRDIVAVHVIGPHRLRLLFDDGIEGEIDVAREISFDGVFEPLRDAAFFSKVRVEPDLGTVVWPNGADLDPLVLYARVTGRPLPTEKHPVAV
jgi:hypothetical protein